MKNPVKSLFNLIEIFRRGVRKTKTVINPVEHCSRLSIHDYYCDQEHLGI